MLVGSHDRDLLFPGIPLESTELARIWQCKSHDVPRLLGIMADNCPGFHYTTLRHGKHGPKPALFQIWLESQLIEDVESVRYIRQIRRADVLDISVELETSLYIAS